MAAAEKAYKAFDEFEPISAYGKGLLDWHLPRTAKALTGRSTSIIWKHVILGKPIIQGMALTQGEDAVIMLKNDLGGFLAYKVFLHECGHILTDWENLWDINGLTRAHYSFDVSSKAAQARMTPREDRANQQAALWFSWAKANTPYRQIPALLTALEDWEPK